MRFMDQVTRRYPDPSFLLNQYIETGRFCEFIKSFCAAQQDSDLWEYYLHRVWDKSFNEFRDDLLTTQKQQSMTDSTIEATVQKSLDILGNFKPEQEGGE